MSGVHDSPDDPDNPTNHTNECYCSDIVSNIEIVYLLAAIFWIFLVFVLRLWENADYIIWLFLILPLVIFAINFFSLGEFTCSMEDQMLKGNLLSFGFIVAVILINWNSPIGQHDKTEFFKILITAFILLMVSLIDVWVEKDKMSIVKHIKTSIQTMSLSLLALSLYLYYTYQRDQE